MKTLLRSPLSTVSALSVVIVLVLAGCSPAEDDAVDTTVVADPGTEDTVGGEGGEDAPDDPEVPQGRLVAVGTRSFDALDPHGANSAEQPVEWVGTHIFDPLVMLRGGEIVPMLAMDWETPDDLTWVFQMRDDATFHDGTEVTAADFVASLERVIELDGPRAGIWEDLESAEATGTHEVTLRTEIPMGLMLNNLTTVRVAPAHHLADGDEIEQNPIGSGPFMFESFVPGERVVLRANPDYWGDGPYIEELEFVYIPEVSSRVTALSTGEVDFAMEFPADQWPQVVELEGVETLEAPSFGAWTGWFNSSREPFTDVRVRRAMRHAVDVETIAEDLFGDLAQVSQSPHAEPVFGWSPQEPYEYDPDLARELLTEAGYPDGFETTMMWRTEQAPGIRPFAEAIVSYWADIGVTVEPQELEAPVWLDRLLTLDFDINHMVIARSDGDAGSGYSILYTCDAERTGYCNEELDSLIEAQATTTDQDERLRILDQINKHVWDNALGMFTLDVKNTYAWQSHVQGIDPAQDQLRVLFHQARVTD